MHACKGRHLGGSSAAVDGGGASASVMLGARCGCAPALLLLLLLLLLMLLLLLLLPGWTGEVLESLKSFSAKHWGAVATLGCSCNIATLQHLGRSWVSDDISKRRGDLMTCLMT